MVARSELILRWSVYGAAGLLVCLVQGLILQRLDLWGVMPFLYPALAAMVAVWEGAVPCGAVYALCLGAAWSLDRTAEQVCSLLEAAWSSETLDEAAGQVAAAHRIWEKNRGISASLVDHERLEDVDEGFSDLQAWLQLGEESEFARTCLSLVKQIRAMAESEKPYYYNIL